jgi:ribosomal protein L20
MRGDTVPAAVVVRKLTYKVAKLRKDDSIDLEGKYMLADQQTKLRAAAAQIAGKKEEGRTFRPLLLIRIMPCIRLWQFSYQKSEVIVAPSKL